jgi:hypothetical protein
MRDGVDYSHDTAASFIWNIGWAFLATYAVFDVRS